MNQNMSQVQKHILFFVSVSVMIAFFTWMFQAVLFPFILGIVIAYLFEPLLKVMDRIKWPRLASASLVTVSFVIIVAAFLGIIGPFLFAEGSALIRELPSYIDRLSAEIEELSRQYGPLLYLEQNDIDVKNLIKENSNLGTNILKQIWEGFLSGGQALTGFVTTIIIAPIVAFFVMREWSSMTEWTTNLLPKDYKETVMDLLSQIDKKVAGFIRGQLLVALVLAIAYAILLSIFGLKYGLLIGLGAGLLNIIPLVGSTVGLLTAAIFAWLQAGEIAYVTLIAGIFITGQVIEGNFLQPWLVGKSVGMHPLWIIFALMAGGALLGILGMFLAVPLAASIGVLISYGLSQYKDSRFYKGQTANG